LLGVASPDVVILTSESQGDFSIVAKMLRKECLNNYETLRNTAMRFCVFLKVAHVLNVVLNNSAFQFLAGKPSMLVRLHFGFARCRPALWVNDFSTVAKTLGKAM
jgi:hypothetical protein